MMSPRLMAANTNEPPASRVPYLTLVEPQDSFADPCESELQPPTRRSSLLGLRQILREIRKDLEILSRLEDDLDAILTSYVQLSGFLQLPAVQQLRNATAEIQDRIESKKELVLELALDMPGALRERSLGMLIGEARFVVAYYETRYHLYDSQISIKHKTQASWINPFALPSQEVRYLTRRRDITQERLADATHYLNTLYILVVDAGPTAQE